MNFIRNTAMALVAATALATPVVASELQLGWYVDSDEQEQKLRTLLAEYTKLHPETTFDLQITPYDGMSEKFRQYAASGIMPDVSLTSSMEPGFSLRRVSRIPCPSSWNTPTVWPDPISS